jgi:hypothetical protein
MPPKAGSSGVARQTAAAAGDVSLYAASNASGRMFWGGHFDRIGRQDVLLCGGMGRQRGSSVRLGHLPFSDSPLALQVSTSPSAVSWARFPRSSPNIWRQTLRLALRDHVHRLFYRGILRRANRLFNSGNQQRRFLQGGLYRRRWVCDRRNLVPSLLVARHANSSTSGCFPALFMKLDRRDAMEQSSPRLPGPSSLLVSHVHTWLAWS